MQRSRITWGVLLALSVLVGCKQKPNSSEQAPQPQPQVETPAPAPVSDSTPSPAPVTTPIVRPSGPIQFTDITAQAGIHFTHNTGAFGKKYLPETMGNGACFLDYD